MKKENNLDRILKYFVNEKSQRNTTASILKFKLFKEDLEQEEINELLLEIHNHRPRIVESSVNSKGKVFAKPIISKCQEFLDEGGFKNLSKEHKNDNLKVEFNVENFIGRDNLGIQSSDSEIIKPNIQNTKKNIEPSKPTKSVLKTIYWIFGILVAITILYTFIMGVTNNT